MMSESFDPNSKFDRFGEDLRLSLDEYTANCQISPGPANDNSPNSTEVARGQTQYANIGNSFEQQQELYDRRGSHGMMEGGGGAMCGSSLSQLASAQSKIDSLKTWGVSAYKCTRQAISERLGKTTRTVDAEMEQNIVALRDLHGRYERLLTLSRSLLSHFHHVQTAQQSLGNFMTDFAGHEPDLRAEFMKNADVQKVIAGNGRALESALSYFISSLDTLCHKTIEDTMLTVRNYETARLEYDAYRADHETLQQTPTRSADQQARIREAEQALQEQKQRYEQLRDDIQVKMRFLHENKVKVMKRQLMLLHNATCAYFGGNQKALENALEQLKIKPATTPNTPPATSWLEA